jgi:hypothetical protein
VLSQAAIAAPVRYLRRVAGVPALQLAERCHVPRQQALTVDRPEPPPGLRLRHSLGHHGRGQLVGDACPGRPHSEDHDPVAGQRHPGRSGRGEHGGQVDRAGALHVVIERQPLIPVPIEQPPGIRHPEILPVQQCQREQLADRTDELVEEGVVLGRGHPGMTVTDIERVIEQLCRSVPTSSMTGIVRAGSIPPAAV